MESIMGAVVALLYDFNVLKQELLFTALADPMGFSFLDNKALDEHYTVFNGCELLFWYNRKDLSTCIIKRSLSGIRVGL